MADKLSHTYARPGNFTITVTDAKGRKGTATFAAYAQEKTTLVIEDFSVTPGTPGEYPTELDHDGPNVDGATSKVTFTFPAAISAEDVVWEQEDFDPDHPGWTPTPLVQASARVLTAESAPFLLINGMRGKVQDRLTVPAGTTGPIQGLSQVIKGKDTLAEVRYTVTVS